jgi:hypothetical protein
LQVFARATLNGVEGCLTGQVLAIEVKHVAFQPALDDPIVDSLEGAAFPLAAFCFAEYCFSHNNVMGRFGFSELRARRGAGLGQRSAIVRAD